jgi:hypothetical protein
MSRRVFSPEGLTLGIGLVAIGVLWIMSNLGQVDLLRALHMGWPLLLVVWGTLELADLFMRRASREKGS